jgi:Tfp pilus assembly protein PilO
MSRDRLWIFGGIALGLVILIAGYTLGISPTLAQAATVSAQTSTISTSNTQSQAQLASLKQQFQHIGTLRSALNKLRGSIPESAGTSPFLNELTVLAAASGVKLNEVTVGDAALYTAPVVAAPATTSTATTSTPAPTAAPAATAPAQTVGNGLVLVPITISAEGPFDSVRDFMGAVQKGTRLYFASAMTIGTDPTGVSTITLTGDAFTLQGTSDVVTNTKLIPTTDSTATPTPTMTPTPTPTPTKSAAGSTSKSGSTTPTTAPTDPSTPLPTDTPSP